MSTDVIPQMVLMVDDSDEVRQMLGSLLTNEGYLVQQAASGAEAIKATEVTVPDLVLLDIKMPGTNGYEVCRRLKAAERTRDVPIVFLSGLVEIGEKARAFAAGGVDYLTKPFEIQEVLARVRTHLVLRQTQANLQELNRHLGQRVADQTKDLREANQKLQEEMRERRLIEAALREEQEKLHNLNASLEQRVEERTRELESAREDALSMMRDADRSRQKTEEALKKLEVSTRRLKRLEETRDNLTHMLVHDLRSPLGTVRMAIELLRLPDFNPGPKRKDILDDAYLACTTLIEMVTQLLDINRLETDQMPLRKTDCDLVAVARKALESVAPLVGDRRVALDGPAALVAKCDESVLQRILGNLLGNALKFTPAGGEIKIAVTRGADEARLVVSDSGPGIPQEFHQKIFEKYFQIEDDRRSRGTGLGLTFCKLAVEAHGGRIGVDDTPGPGCSFWFTLPLDIRQ